MNATNSQGVLVPLEPPTLGGFSAASPPLSPTSEPDDFPPTPPQAHAAAAVVGLQALSRHSAAGPSHSPGRAADAGPSLSGESVMSRFPESSGIGSVDDSGRAVGARAGSLARGASTAGYAGTTATEGETPQTTFYSRGGSGKPLVQQSPATAAGSGQTAPAASRAATLSAQPKEARASSAAETTASASRKVAPPAAAAGPAASSESAASFRSGIVVTSPPRTEKKKTPSGQMANDSASKSSAATKAPAKTSSGRTAADSASKSSASTKALAKDAELAASLAAAEKGRPPRRAASKAANYAPDVDKDGNPLPKARSSAAAAGPSAVARTTRQQDQSSAATSGRTQAAGARRSNQRTLVISSEEESSDGEEAKGAKARSRNSSAAKAKSTASRSSHPSEATATKGSTSSKRGRAEYDNDETDEDEPVGPTRRLPAPAETTQGRARSARDAQTSKRAFVIADDAADSGDGEEREGDSSAHEDDAARAPQPEGRGQRTKKPSSRLQATNAEAQASSKGSQSRAGSSRSAALVCVEVDVSRPANRSAAKTSTAATGCTEPASRLPLKAGGKDAPAAQPVEVTQAAASEAQSAKAGAESSKAARTSPRKRKASPAKVSPAKAPPRKAARRGVKTLPDSDAEEAEEDDEMATPEQPVSAPKTPAAAITASPVKQADIPSAGPSADAGASTVLRTPASKSTAGSKAGDLHNAAEATRSSLANRPFKTPTTSRTDGESAGGSSLRRSFSGKPLAALVGASGGHRRPGLGKRSFVPPLHANRKAAPAPRAPLLVKKTKAEERAEAELMLDSDEERERAAETPSQRMRRRIREAEEEPMEPPAGWATAKSKPGADAGHSRSADLSWGGDEGADHAVEDYD